MKRCIISFLICLLLNLSPSAPAVADETLATETPDKSASLQANAPTADKYMQLLQSALDTRGIGFQRLDSSDPYTLIINSSTILETTQTNGDIEGIVITAQGDMSAMSGEIIFDVFSSAIAAYASADSEHVRMELLGLISSVGGTAYAFGLEITLSLTNEAAELKLIPSNSNEPHGTGEVPTKRFSDINELIKYCTMSLPEGWTQTSYQTVSEQVNVLINVYTTDDDMEALWSSAHTINAHFWRAANESGLSCDRLSVVFYSSSMVPLLSIGISRADVVDNELIIGQDTDDAQFRNEFERLAQESDALVVTYD